MSAPRAHPKGLDTSGSILMGEFRAELPDVVDRVKYRYRGAPPPLRPDACETPADLARVGWATAPVEDEDPLRSSVITGIKSKGFKGRK